MRTTLDSGGELRAAKAQAAQEGKSLTVFLEESLRARLELARAVRAPFKLKLSTVKGPLPPLSPPGVDFADRDSLYRWMEGSTE